MRLGTGIVLIALGAILAFAVNVQLSGIDLRVVGWILMVVGEIVQANVFGKIRFDLVAAGQVVGAIQAENWRAWDFALIDAAGTEVARITKRWEGLARTLFTTADKYVVHVHFKLPEPLASMVIAAALTVDTALKQDDRGFN